MKVLDRAIGLLMLPRVRFLRRWSFLLTGPVAAWLIATGHGATGGLVVAARVTLTLVVVAVAHRIPGERGEAVRDLLMHPRARAFLRAEADVLVTIPRLLLGHGRAEPAYRYAGRGSPVAVAAAFTPAVLAEAVAFHLLMPAGWIVAHVVLAAIHVYALLWLWSWALGPRAWPHAVRRGVLTVRRGPLYRTRVPLSAIAAARVEGRQVVLEMSEPAVHDEPLAERTTVDRVVLASNDPEALAAELTRLAAPTAAQPDRPAPLLQLALEPLAAFELARG
ncbi:MAG: hypothetical protein QOE98_2024 [Gaiellaceae bacterium]|nr:hypothetical protein [Gaiellaceae bacterium]MEA2468142.1 hypothetical protein [Thermoleophilaceae bacterium]